jgi:uncharacterized RDD family membrane protein YckC
MDIAMIAVPALIIGFGLGFVSVVFAVVGYLLAAGVFVWFSAQVGMTGQSPGMRVMGLQCLSTQTGQPLGLWMGIVRGVGHTLLGAACGIGAVVDLLYPLWDIYKQTVADKMVSTVVVVVPKRSFSLV